MKSKPFDRPCEGDENQETYGQVETLLLYVSLDVVRHALGLLTCRKNSSTVKQVYAPQKKELPNR